MIDQQQALAIVEAHLATLAQRLGEPLQIIEFQEKEQGWVFFYESRNYLETQDISVMLVGNSPLLVLRADGTLHLVSTSKPLDQALADAARAA
jgi:hypothetical protein